ncbi:ubiquitin-protein ligase Sel1/Ubx2 [Magnaporthiopsis poae ATCC 64411]|uniref:Ubiquitin-protein ligase Sel1/Ubx2 n=1 Tax=Magnaporthiopsis poae (strain ATCC 64411 / 73-15) TaxID=644358 RepID=A0A0C4E5F1_MAGP6|nr:ubiquitin-protein ligase Sel1/Ubx2 [Magnaporthiopsis poae ATCC 64411]
MGRAVVWLLLISQGIAWASGVAAARARAPDDGNPQTEVLAGVAAGGDAVRLLEASAQKNNSDALYLLAEMNFYGNFSLPRDFSAAFRNYQILATLNGNSSAMYMLGLMYSTGVGGAVERDQAKALLYYTFAALRGHTRAQMTVAARHAAGIGTAKKCEEACKYYKLVADKAVEWYRSGPPGGMGWATESHRIADDFGGVYGEGASVSSSGINAAHTHASFDRYASIADVIEYLDVLVHKGDFRASFNLGRIYYDGQRGLDRDFKAARKYFLKVVAKYWKDGRAVENAAPQLDRVAGKAAGYLGRMYMRGEGVEQNMERSRDWYNRGIAQGDAQSQYGLGLLLMGGHGVSRNMVRATELFKAAAAQDYAPANVKLGSLYLDQGGPEDLRAANDCFEQAAKYGNLEAHYYLAEMISHGVGRDRSCSQALSYYRSVAEKAEPLVSSWAEANQAHDDGELETAFLQYLGVAEQGYERAQSNVAYLLDEQTSRLPLPTWLTRRAPRPSLLRDPSLGLIYWTRSSRQGNIDSLVKMGDYYLAGVGADADVDKAVQCYTGAADYHQSAQALYNLGWMHEYGVGLDQDYHLAKRYYDEALMTNDEAYLPVTLALLKLRVKSAWNTLTNGRINSIQDDPGRGNDSSFEQQLTHYSSPFCAKAPAKDWSLSEWIANFLQEDQFIYDEGQLDASYDQTMPGADSPLPEEIEEGLTETFIILGLAAALAFLVYYRQQRQQAHREENAAMRARAGGRGPAGGPEAPRDRGVFPPADRPEFQQWVAGGIGH